MEFDNVTEAIRPRLLRTAAAFLKVEDGAEEAEDIVQETLLTLWQLIRGGYPVRDFEALSVKICKNACVSRYRKSMKGRAGIMVEEVPGGESSSSRTDFSDSEILRERLLGGLTQTQRELLRMRNEEGLSLDRIARLSGKTKASVKTTISAARKKMFEELKKES